MPDLTKLIQYLPMLITWGTLLGALSLILFYGSLARHGLPKISWSYRMVARICLGSCIFFLSLQLGQFLPSFWDLPGFILAPLKSFVTGILLSISTMISFYFFFYKQRHDQRAKGKTKIQQFMHDNKKIIGTVLLITIIVVSVVGVLTPKPTKAGLDLPIFGTVFKTEAPDCLHVRSVMQMLSADELFEESVAQYKSPEKLTFLLEDYPGYKIKSSSIAETADSAYILSILTLEGYDESGMSGPDELFNIKFCTVRPVDMVKCDCSGFIGVADVIIGKLKEGGEELAEEVEQFKKMVESDIGDLEK